MDKPGLELLYEHITNQIKEPQDALVCVLHWHIISNGFKCTGVGDTPSNKQKKTEKLPAGWNQSSDVYVLKYQSTKQEESFTLKAILADDTLIVNFMRDRDEKVASMPIRVGDYVTDNLKDFDEAFRNLSELTKCFKKEIMIEFSASGSSKESRNLSDEKATRSRPPYGESYTQGPDRPRGHQSNWPDRQEPFVYGRGDLDPLGGGAGGMIMDPRGTHGARGPRFGISPGGTYPVQLPPGAVPPGARFDPFSPVPGPGSRPNPDHMRPPGFDDMQM
ncbi:proteasome inhibitor PI31 subunit-like [Gigantopelta aegis]|uniref:proteasome inhibitor PI31 subunit-like n=1 Tax=Gigantopelta aegis TaxID=1735272 RepID=UPI001B88A64F|nr:proteasome inhibitor PI31 subunit-like [Gigantopelta aegis]